MFVGRIARAEALKKLMNVLSELLEVGILCFTDAGVCLRSLDRARVSLVTVVLWPASFEAFDLDGDLDVCVRFEAFADALRFAEDAAVVTLRVEGVGDKMVLAFHNRNEVVRSELNTVHTEDDPEGVPDFHFTNSVEMPSGQLQQLCRKLARIGDTVTITVSAQDFTFETTGDHQSLTVATQASEEHEVDVWAEEPVAARFSLRYLISFVKATPLASLVTFQVAGGQLMVEYSIAGLGALRFYLGPKIHSIDSEDEDSDNEE